MYLSQCSTYVRADQSVLAAADMSSVLRVVTVLGKRLSPRGQPEAELVDRCAAAARVARAGQEDSSASKSCIRITSEGL